MTKLVYGKATIRKNSFSDVHYLWPMDKVAVKRQDFRRMEYLMSIQP